MEELMEHKILVVEDDVVISKALRRYLESQAFQVISAQNGAEACQLIKECQPDLVLTDAQMPEMDGHTLCRFIRGDKATARIPIIIMSGQRIQENNVLAGFEEGADDYILKPVSMPLIKARIDAVLKRSGGVFQKGKTVIFQNLELDLEGRSAKIS